VYWWVNFNVKSGRRCVNVKLQELHYFEPIDSDVSPRLWVWLYLVRDCPFAVLEICWTVSMAEILNLLDFQSPVPEIFRLLQTILGHFGTHSMGHPSWKWLCSFKTWRTTQYEEEIARVNQNESLERWWILRVGFTLWPHWPPVFTILHCYPWMDVKHIASSGGPR
jgi:hypothetical protein